MVTDFREHVCDILDHSKCAFGEDVVYTPRGQQPINIRGIFDREFQQVDPDTEIVIASNTPMLGVKLADIPFKPKKGDKVKIRNIEYKLTDAQEDGQGGASLILHKVSS